MTELDFDELDKAVNSLMAESKQPEPSPSVAPSAPSVPSVPASTAPAAHVTPMPTEPVNASNSPSPAVRRRGQFMDVIRPAANRPAPAPAKNQGIDVTPPTIQEATSPDTNSLSPTPLDDASPAAFAPIQPQQPELAGTEPVETSEVESGDQTTAQAEQPSQEQSDSMGSPLSTEDPLVSPFLPDAKVDKRPLGGASLPEGALPTELPLESAEAEPAAPDTEPEPQPEPEPTPVPDELQQDVVAVEANVVVHEDMPAPDNSEQSEPTVQSEDEVMPVAEVSALPAGGSIAQQYEEQPSTGDQTNGAIFDTSTYHQPLETQPHKKKSAVLAWVLWIIVLLVVGATAGAAWFYFTTQ